MIVISFMNMVILLSAIMTILLILGKGVRGLLIC